MIFPYRGHSHIPRHAYNTCYKLTSWEILLSQLIYIIDKTPETIESRLRYLDHVHQLFFGCTEKGVIFHLFMTDSSWLRLAIRHILVPRGANMIDMAWCRRTAVTAISGAHNGTFFPPMGKSLLQTKAHFLSSWPENCLFLVVGDVKSIGDTRIQT